MRYNYCAAQLGAPGLGGILLSVRVSREDDNAHGIAVASFGAPTLASQWRAEHEVEASR